MTKGGITLRAALDMELDDFEAWCDAAVELERRISEATK
jgi:hypothetical protein